MMSLPTKGRRLSLLLPALLLVATLGWPTCRLHAQEDWARRDKWQRPADVLDALGVKPGSFMADVGAGDGYFTFHLAARVGSQGRVYAEDILEDELAKVRSRKAKQGLSQIETILGTPSDPRLPVETLDAILVVNAYHEMREFDAMLQGMNGALKPGGSLAIIDAQDEPGQPRSAYQERHTLLAEIVCEDAARHGLRFQRELPGFSNPENKRKYYFLIFERPKRI